MAMAAAIYDQEMAEGTVLKLRADIGDDLLAVAYLKWKDEGILSVIFHDHPDITLQQFLDFHKQPTMEYLSCFASRPTLDMEQVGLGWINSTRQFGQDKIAEVGIGFHRHVGRDTCQRLTEMLIKHCFYTRRFVAIYGVSPVESPTIHVFAKRLGFQEFGPLPKFCGYFGKAADAIIYCLTREAWEEQRHDVQ